jgi:hypothetical protein
LFFGECRITLPCQINNVRRDRSGEERRKEKVSEEREKAKNESEFVATFKHPLRGLSCSLLIQSFSSTFSFPFLMTTPSNIDFEAYINSYQGKVK